MRGLIAGLALAAPLACLGAEGAVTCPATLAEKPDVQNPPAPWVVVAPAGEKPLERAAVYLGAPPDLDGLVPDATAKSKGVETVRWQLVRAPADRYWLACSYAGTTAMLARELDKSVSKCAVAYDLLPNGKRQGVRSIVCN